MMLHLEWKSELGTYIIDIPDKIICTDNRFPPFYNKILELKTDYIFDELVVVIHNWINYEWFWMDELEDLKYIDFERVQKIKAFL